MLSTRLFAALMASCLLHAALVFTPCFSAITAVSRPAVRDEQKPGPARILDLRLARESGPAATAAPNAAAAAGAKARPAASGGPRPGFDRAAGIGLLPIPAPAYYPADRLSKRPRPVADPNLEVPETWPMFPPGRIVLRLWISEFGNVVSVEVEMSELPEAVAAAAAAAFEKLRFVPGELDGRPVGARMRIEVTYDYGTTPPP